MKNLFLFIIIVFIFIFITNYFIKNKENFNNTIQGYSDENSNWIEPKIFKNLITKEDADYIIQKSEKLFTTSQIMSGIDTNIRKSETAWIDKSDPIIYKIIKKVCDINNLPIDNAEPLQIVRYGPSGYYNEHHDACCDENEECRNFIKFGGQRQKTMVIYLTDDFEGGGTIFPKLNKIIKPNRCDGILFNPLETGTSKCHPKALHAGMPVKSGIKYIANVWIREDKFK